MQRLLLGGEGDEQWNLTLFVYDSATLSLRPTIHRGTWPTEKMDFDIPLGGGIAGASFLQSRMIPWSRTKAEDSLIEPIPYAVEGPAVDMNNMLSIPLYHPAKQDDRHPPLWAIVGVLSFGTTSFASNIAKLHGSGKAVDDLGRDLRTLAQIHVSAMIGALFARS